MRKINKIIGYSAAIALVSVTAATATVKASPFSEIRNKITSVLSIGRTKDKKADACLKNALNAYRNSLKGNRDKYVSSSNDLRAGYRAEVGQAVTNLHNANSSDSHLRNQLKKDLSQTRSTAVKEWSDKLNAARESWLTGQKSANEDYRLARANCLGQTVNANTNSVPPVNQNSNGNENAPVNANGNANENANTNANVNENTNLNANENTNTAANDNTNAAVNVNTNQ